MVSMVHAEARLFMGRAATCWAARAPLGSGAAPRLRRARLLRDHGPEPHSGNDHAGAAAPRRVGEQSTATRSHLLAILLARTGRCACAHAHMRAHTHTHVHVHVRAHVHVRMRMRVRVRVHVLASRRASERRASAQAHLRVKGGLTAASQVALCVRAQERPRLQPRALPRQGTRRQRLRAASGRRGAHGALESRPTGHSGSSHSSWR